MRCGLLLLDRCRRRVAFAGFDDYLGGMLVVAASDGVVVEVRVDVPIRPERVVLRRCVARLASMSQSDRPVLYCLLTYVYVPIQPAIFVSLFFLSLVAWLCSPRNIILYFSNISIETHSSSVSFVKKTRFVLYDEITDAT